MGSTYYDTLGVGPLADADAIQRAYLERAEAASTAVDPDPVRLAQLHEAWNTLGDPAARGRYDASLAAAQDPHAATRRRNRDVAAQPRCRTMEIDQRVSDVFAEVLGERLIAMSAIDALQMAGLWYPDRAVPGRLARSLFLEAAAFDLFTVRECMQVQWPAPAAEYLWGIALGRAVKKAKRLTKRDFRYRGQRIADRWVPVASVEIVELHAVRAAEYGPLPVDDPTDPLAERLELWAMRLAAGMDCPQRSGPPRGRISVATKHLLAVATEPGDIDRSLYSIKGVAVWEMVSLSHNTWSRLIAGARLGPAQPAIATRR